MTWARHRVRSPIAIGIPNETRPIRTFIGRSIGRKFDSVNVTRDLGGELPNNTRLHTEGTLSHWLDKKKGFTFSVLGEVFITATSLLIRPLAEPTSSDTRSPIFTWYCRCRCCLRRYFLLRRFFLGEGTIYSFWLTTTRERMKPPKVLDVVKMSISRGAQLQSVGGSFVSLFCKKSFEGKETQPNFFEGLFLPSMPPPKYKALSERI